MFSVGKNKDIKHEIGSQPFQICYYPHRLVVIISNDPRFLLFTPARAQTSALYLLLVITVFGFQIALFRNIQQIQHWGDFYREETISTFHWLMRVRRGWDVYEDNLYCSTWGWLVQAPPYSGLISLHLLASLIRGWWSTLSDVRLRGQMIDCAWQLNKTIKDNLFYFLKEEVSVW